MTSPNSLRKRHGVRLVANSDLRPITTRQRLVTSTVNEYCNGRTLTSGTRGRMAPGRSASSRGAAGTTVTGSLLLRSSTTPIAHLMGSVLLRTIHDGTSSVRFRPFTRQATIQFHVSKILRRQTMPPGRLRTTLVSHLGIVTKVSVTRHHLPRSKVSRIRVNGGSVSVHASAVPITSKRQIILQLLGQSGTSLPVRSLNVASRVLSSFHDLVRAPGNVVVISNPANSNGAAALCTTLNRLSSGEGGVLAVRSPIRCHLPGVNRVRMGPGVNLAFTDKLERVLHRSPSVILINRAHSPRATRVTMHTSLANRLIFAALRAGSTPSTVVHLASVNVPPCLLTSSLHKILTRQLIHELYPRYTRHGTLASGRVSTCRVPSL